MIDAPPPVFLIHCHDLGRAGPGYADLAPAMPALTAFARESVVFARAYATSPLCSPARGSLMTGRYPHSNGLMGLVNRGWKLPEGEVTMAEWLGRHGYRSVLVGVQHERPPEAPTGFEHARTFGEDTGHAAATVADWAGEEIEKASRDRRPPFFSIGFFEPHREAGSYEPFRDKAVESGGRGMAEPLRGRPGEVEDWAGFLGSCCVLDEGLDRVFTAIRSAGLWDKSWIIFTTDHGIAFPRLKSTLYEGGIGVALMVKPPRGGGRDPGETRALVSHVDLLPTLCDVLGLPVPPGVQGQSFAPVLRGKADVAREFVFAEKNYHSTYDPIRSVRDDRWLLIRNFEPGRPVEIPKDVSRGGAWKEMASDPWPPRPGLELYDAEADPQQMRNLAEDADLEPVRERLLGALHAWMVSTDDPLLKGPIKLPEPGAPNASGLGGP